jgi:hypothetical protein
MNPSLGDNPDAIKIMNIVNLFKWNKLYPFVETPLFIIL